MRCMYVYRGYITPSRGKDANLWGRKIPFDELERFFFKVRLLPPPPTLNVYVLFPRPGALLWVGIFMALPGRRKRVRAMGNSSEIDSFYVARSLRQLLNPLFWDAHENLSMQNAFRVLPWTDTRYTVNSRLTFKESIYAQVGRACLPSRFPEVIKILPKASDA